MEFSDVSSGVQSKSIVVGDTSIHYLEQGNGQPILLLHGLPASSWVWRKVIPHLSPLSRCVAPDLVGFGQSGEEDTGYKLSDQFHYLDEFIKSLNLNNITFILHGWGGVLGLAWAMQNEEKCRSLVFYETWIHPVTDDYISLPYHEIINFWKEEKNLQQAEKKGLSFVDQFLNQMALQPFDENAMAHYCAPFTQTGAGKPLMQFLMDAPTGDGKSPVDVMLADSVKKLQQSNLPKLLLFSVPGFLTTIATIEWAKKSLPELQVMELGEGLHYGQENQPDLMGEMISAWLQGVEI